MSESTYTILKNYVSLAPQTSIETAQQGHQFGGTLAWTYVVLMSNDSGEHPFAPVLAALVGYPITILCDISLLIPSLIISFMNGKVNPKQGE